MALVTLWVSFGEHWSLRNSAQIQSRGLGVLDRQNGFDSDCFEHSDLLMRTPIKECIRSIITARLTITTIIGFILIFIYRNAL